MTTWLIRSLLISTLLIASAGTVMAGGWATVRLDEAPGVVTEGEVWRFGFVVKQHDRTPINNVRPVVEAIHVESAETVTAEAEQVGQVGHFEAELRLPTAGEWKWSITPEPFGATSLEMLTVVNANDSVGADVAEAEPAGAIVAQGPRGGLRTSFTIDIAPLSTAVAAPEPVEITITDAGFSPSSVEIPAGSEVIWTNRSSIPHGVMSDNLAFRDSGLLDNEDEYRQTFEAAGTYPYWCGPHPFMTGTIVVTGDDTATLE